MDNKENERELFEEEIEEPAILDEDAVLGAVDILDEDDLEEDDDDLEEEEDLEEDDDDLEEDDDDLAEDEEELYPDFDSFED